MKIKYFNRNLMGLTLVELLLVISLIGILSGAVLSLLNPNRQRLIAEDGVRRSNFSKLVDGLETYFAGEGHYPVDTASASIAPYLNAWPTEPIHNGTVTTYTYASPAGQASFRLLVTLATGGCLKYSSTIAVHKIYTCQNGAAACTIANDSITSCE